MVQKMGSVCSVLHCKNYSIEKNARSFHRFPKDKNLCAEWIQRCRRLDLDCIFKTKGPDLLRNNFRVCSDHFLISDYNNPNLKSQGLKHGVKPSVNLPGKNFKTTIWKRCRKVALPVSDEPYLQVAESGCGITDSESRESPLTFSSDHDCSEEPVLANGNTTLTFDSEHDCSEESVLAKENRLLESPISADLEVAAVQYQKKNMARNLKTYERFSSQSSKSEKLNLEMSNEPVMTFKSLLRDYSVHRVAPIEAIVNIHSSTNDVSTMTVLSQEIYSQVFDENKKLRKRIAELEEQLVVANSKTRKRKAQR